MPFTTDSIRFAIQSIASGAEPVGAYLNELDGKLGDGDLGVTMINGFGNMASIADDLPSDVGMACMESAKAMTKVSGSSFGTLMGIALMAAAKKTKGQTDVPWSEIPGLVQAALDAMIARGGASLGDKTMLDSLDAIIAALQGQSDPSQMLQSAVSAADDALADYNGKVCKIGRARIFGDKTIGMDDPGMVAIQKMLGLMQAAQP